VVLPPKFVEEIRAMPNELANPTSAHSHNLLGKHTNMDIIMKSNLHFRMIQSKLTPALASLAAPIQDELNYAVQRELPDCKGSFYDKQTQMYRDNF
jgi:ent-kaurene oxidase